MTVNEKPYTHVEVTHEWGRDGNDTALLAELVTPGIEPTALFAELTAAQQRIRAVYETVIEAGSISAIAG